MRLEEERANNNDRCVLPLLVIQTVHGRVTASPYREIKYKKEIEKLKQELDQERKEVIRLDVQLDTVQASKDVRISLVMKRMD